MEDAGSSGAELVSETLSAAGIEVVFGLPGTQTLPLDRVLAARDDIRYVMARHETAIPHMAWGYHEAGGGWAATLTVPGPGDTNAMHGLKNALEDCVPLVHIAADPDPAARGKGPIHEIDSHTYDPVVKLNVVVEHRAELPDALATALTAAREPPTGPVRLGIPAILLEAPAHRGPSETTSETVTRETASGYRSAFELLRSADRPVVYAGGGLRRATNGARAGATAVRTLVEAWNVPVLTTYKGKGLIPEDLEQSVGVTASFLPAPGRAILEAADVVLALGTDFDGPTTAGWSLPMGESLVHVTLDPTAVDASYEATASIIDDAAAAARRFATELTGPLGWDGSALGSWARTSYRERLAAADLLDRDQRPATTPATLEAVRGATPAEATVVTDIGGHRLWALELFRADGPHRYLTAGSWAGMGVGLPGAIGAKVARPDAPVIVLHGDGGLMMCLQELHTAAEANIPIVVVVFVDADYGIISKDSAIYDGIDRRFAWNSPSFLDIAQGFGCQGVEVDTASAAATAVETAISAERTVPTVISVRIQGDEPTAKDVAEFPLDRSPTAVG